MDIQFNRREKINTKFNGRAYFHTFSSVIIQTNEKKEKRARVNHRTNLPKSTTTTNDIYELIGVQRFCRTNKMSSLIFALRNAQIFAYLNYLSRAIRLRYRLQSIKTGDFLLRPSKANHF